MIKGLTAIVGLLLSLGSLAAFFMFLMMPHDTLANYILDFVGLGLVCVAFWISGVLHDLSMWREYRKRR